MNKADLEVIIQLKALDDTFSQHVHARHAYIIDEIVVGTKFKPASKVNDSGELIHSP